jgi:hypothetical protein
MSVEHCLQSCTGPLLAIVIFAADDSAWMAGQNCDVHRTLSMSATGQESALESALHGGASPPALPSGHGGLFREIVDDLCGTATSDTRGLQADIRIRTDVAQARGLPPVPLGPTPPWIGAVRCLDAKSWPTSIRAALATARAPAVRARGRCRPSVWRARLPGAANATATCPRLSCAWG